MAHPDDELAEYEHNGSTYQLDRKTAEAWGAKAVSAPKNKEAKTPKNKAVSPESSK
jgi:hypothetical protein